MSLISAGSISLDSAFKYAHAKSDKNHRTVSFRQFGIAEITFKIIDAHHRVHRVATAAFRRTFHHEGKISSGW